MTCQRCKERLGLYYWNMRFQRICYKCYSELLEENKLKFKEKEDEYSRT